MRGSYLWFDATLRMEEVRLRLERRERRREEGGDPFYPMDVGVLISGGMWQGQLV